MAALASRAGSRSAGSTASRPSRSGSAAMARNSAAVSRQESGAPGADQPAATSSAWARISATDGMSRTGPPPPPIRGPPHRPARSTNPRPPHPAYPARNGRPAHALWPAGPAPIYSVYSAARGPGVVS
jgi:hypothetical protein